MNVIAQEANARQPPAFLGRRSNDHLPRRLQHVSLNFTPAAVRFNNDLNPINVSPSIAGLDNGKINTRIVKLKCDEPIVDSRIGHRMSADLMSNISIKSFIVGCSDGIESIIPSECGGITITNAILPSTFNRTDDFRRRYAWPSADKELHHTWTRWLTLFDVRAIRLAEEEHSPQKRSATNSTDTHWNNSQGCKAVSLASHLFWLVSLGFLKACTYLCR